MVRRICWSLLGGFYTSGSETTKGHQALWPIFVVLQEARPPRWSAFRQQPLLCSQVPVDHVVCTMKNMDYLTLAENVPIPVLCHKMVRVGFSGLCDFFSPHQTICFGKDKVFVTSIQRAVSSIQAVCVRTVVLFIRTCNFMGRPFVPYDRYSQAHSRKINKWNDILQNVRKLMRKESL